MPKGPGIFASLVHAPSKFEIRWHSSSHAIFFSRSAIGRVGQVQASWLASDSRASVGQHGQVLFCLRSSRWNGTSWTTSTNDGRRIIVTLPPRLDLQREREAHWERNAGHPGIQEKKPRWVDKKRASERGYGTSFVGDLVRNH